MAKPIAVIISDIHFTPATLDLATKALQDAQNKALTLGVPLIIAGDTLDTKAIIRAECANRLISIFSNCNLETYVIVGNHDLVNEKSFEHSLNFLKPYVNLVSYPVKVSLSGKNVWLVPYEHDTDNLKSFLESLDKGSTLIMHQGLQGADMGHYVQDKTSLTKDIFANFRVISGHYHKRQDIKCGKPKKDAIGLFSYIGNPYTLTFGEANDPPKGYQILLDNGLLEFVPTNLRKHIIVDRTVDTLFTPLEGSTIDDLVWVKVRGSRVELSKLKKAIIGQKLLGHENFKLDLIPTDSELIVNKPLQLDLTPGEMLDKIIDTVPECSPEHLKRLWREVMGS